MGLGHDQRTKKAAITALAPLTDVLDDVDARIEELLARVKQLESP